MATVLYSNLNIFKFKIDSFLKVKILNIMKYFPDKMFIILLDYNLALLN